MSKTKRPADRGIEIHWADMCRTLRIFGHMEDYSKGECYRIHGLLKQAIADGRVERVKRGVYRRIIPKAEQPEAEPLPPV